MLGSLVFEVGASLVWPFLSLYIQNKIAIPLRYSTLLISLRALSGVLASFFFAGNFADRFGRRFLILSSLGGGFFYFLGLKQANQLWQFAILMIFGGMMDIFYPVGINAMIADIVPQENRLEAYSVMRVVFNFGFGVGPIIGGIMVTHSYDTIFIVGALGYALSFLIMFLFTTETLTDEIRATAANNQKENVGILVVMKDRLYIWSVFLNGMIFITSAGVFSLLSLYANQNYGIPENQISYVFTVNALMCVFMQLPVSRKIKWNPPLALMSLSGLLYCVSVCAISFVDRVWWYCLCMAVMTIGELILSPTMSDIAANLAPAFARGRYMSVLSLARPFGQSIGPAILGFVNDTISPRMMWVVGSVFAGIAGIVFFFMNRRVGDSERLRRG